MKSVKRTLASAGMGAAGAALVLVTVYEGRVAIANRDQEVEIGPGEIGVVSEKGEPRVGEEQPTGGGQPALRWQSDGVEEKLRRQSQLIAHLQEQVASAARAEAAREAPAARARFENENRDPVWAPVQEQELSRRLVRYMGVQESELATECRERCCHVALGSEELNAYYRAFVDFKSNVGVGVGFGDTGWNALQDFDPQQSDDGLGHIYACLDGSGSTEEAELPDRGLERERLLLAAESQLGRCARGLDVPLAVTLYVDIDPHGAISDIDTRANPAGEPAIRCVEQAILSVADFGPAPATTWIPIRVELSPVAGSP